MFVVPVSEHSVRISMIPTGCLKAEFDSTYPIHLNGIISQEEFRESINKINRTINTKKTILVLLSVLFVLCIVGGMILFIVGAMVLRRENTYGFSSYFIAGIILTSFGSMLFSFGCCTVQMKRMSRVRQTIAEESIKYSSRSPIPCSWRLETVTNYFGVYQNNRNVNVANQLVIDIGRPTLPTNEVYYNIQNSNQPVSFFGQQNHFDPPAYSTEHNVICRHCETSRKNPSDRFCSSCGQSFDK